MATQFAHRSVLLEKSLSLLELRSNSLIVDGTVGGGGHAAAILEHTAPDGRLIGLDRDPQALEAAERRLAAYGDRVRLVRASFRHLQEVLADAGVPLVDGVLLDLGVSSPQLDDPRRGFRFAADTADDTALDMRMDPDAPITAAELLRFGFGRGARDLVPRVRGPAGGATPGAGHRRGARAGAAAHDAGPAERHRGGPGRSREAPPSRHPRRSRPCESRSTTRSAASMKASTPPSTSLRPGGRLAVIAYHSVEDRVVKNCFRDAQRGCICPPHTPVCICGGRVRLRIVTKRPISPDEDELRENPRARSARLRAAERVAEAA